MPLSASSGIRSAGGDPVDRAVQRGGVHAAAGVLAERGEARYAPTRDALFARPARPQLRGLDEAAAEVAEHVPAVGCRHRAVAHHDASTLFPVARLRIS